MTSYQLKSIYIFTPILLFLVLVTFSLSSYAVSDSICGLAGEDTKAVRDCIHSYLAYQKMNHSTDNAMQQTLDENRNTTRHMQTFQNITAYHDWVISKPKLGELMTWNDIEKRSWYDVYTKQTLNEMQMQIKLWKEYDHNPVPVPATCPAWHVCGSDNTPESMVKLVNEIRQGLNNTNSTITLKPEMQQNPSGYIHSDSTVKNWNDLDNATNSTKPKP